MELNELVTNKDGRLSTTATVQLLAFLSVVAALFLAIMLDRNYVPEIIYAVTAFGVGTAGTKGAVSVLQGKRDGNN